MPKSAENRNACTKNNIDNQFRLGQNNGRRFLAFDVFTCCALSEIDTQLNIFLQFAFKKLLSIKQVKGFVPFHGNFVLV